MKRLNLEKWEGHGWWLIFQSDNPKKMRKFNLLAREMSSKLCGYQEANSSSWSRFEFLGNGEEILEASRKIAKELGVELGVELKL